MFAFDEIKVIPISLLEIVLSKIELLNTKFKNIPIIAVEHLKDFFILDGHHRSFLRKKILKENIKTYLFKFPLNKQYKAPIKRPLSTIPIREVVGIDDPIIKTWGNILTLLKYYEQMYDTPFSLKKESIPLKKLIPTQLTVRKNQLKIIKEICVPITCVNYANKFYILDYYYVYFLHPMQKPLHLSFFHSIF